METAESADDKGNSHQFASRGNGSNLPWIEKYRPNNLQELIAHEEIIQILNKLINTNKLPHLLFYGPPGTGTYWASMFY